MSPTGFATKLIDDGPVPDSPMATNYIELTSTSGFEPRLVTQDDEVIQASRRLSSLTHSVESTSTSRVGQFGFEVSLQDELKDVKAATWTYSKTARKLYVRRSVPCPFIYRLAAPHSLPPRTMLRISAVYQHSPHAAEPVRRCPNHATAGGDTTLSSSSFVTAQHPLAVYEQHPNNGHISIVIPHETPQVGSQSVTLLLEFHCFSSCSGGLNRRPVFVVFTLESAAGSPSTVLGRQELDVRVCACPVRDRCVDEQPPAATGTESPRRRRAVQAADPVGGRPPSKWRATVTDDSCNDDDEDVFTVMITDRRCYEILRHLRNCMERARSAPSLVAAVRRQCPRQSNSRQRRLSEEAVNGTVPQGIGDVFNDRSLSVGITATSENYPVFNHYVDMQSSSSLMSTISNPVSRYSNCNYTNT